MPLPMRDEDLLNAARGDQLAAEVDAYRTLQRAALVLPLRMRTAVDGAATSHAELLLAVRAANRTPDVLAIEAQPGRPQDLRLLAAGDHLSVQLAGVTGATVHVATASVPTEQIARELLALCAMALSMVGQSALAGRTAHSYVRRRAP